MPKQREPYPNKLRELEALQRALGDESPSLPGDESPSRPVDQDTGGLVDQSPSLPVPQSPRRLVAPSPGSRAAKSSSGAYVKVCVYLPVDLARWLKVQAATSGHELSEIVTEALQERRERNEQT